MVVWCTSLVKGSEQTSSRLSPGLSFSLSLSLLSLSLSMFFCCASLEHTSEKKQHKEGMGENVVSQGEQRNSIGVPQARKEVHARAKEQKPVPPLYYPLRGHKRLSFF